MLPLLVSVLIVLSLSSCAWAITPSQTVQSLFADANRLLNDPETEDRPFERFAAVGQLVNNTFDFPGAAELALGRRWQTMTKTEQGEFTTLFSALLGRSFILRMVSRASLSGGVKVLYLGESVEAGQALVRTSIARRDNGEIRVDYRMIEQDQRWKVRDVNVDGISYVANYRAQLGRVLETASVPELLAQMRARASASTPGAPTPAAVAAASPAAAAGDPIPPVAIASAPAPDDEPVAAPIPPAANALVAIAAAPLDAEPAATTSASPVADEPVVVTSTGATVAVGAARPAAVDVVPSAAVAVVPAARVEPAPGPAVVAVPTPSAVARVPAPTIVAAAAPAPDKELEPQRVALREDTQETPAPKAAPRAAVEPAPRVTAVTSRPSPAPRAYWLQMGPFRTVQEAGRVAARLRGSKLVTATEGVRIAGKPSPKVRVGPFPTAARAVSQQLKLQKKGYNAFMVAER